MGTGRLTVRVGEVVVDLAPDGPWVVGRHSAASVVVDDDLVSRRHLQLAVEDDRWILTDLDSANGTYVAGHPLRRAPIDAVLSVRLGDPDTGVEVLFTVAGDAAPGRDVVPTVLLLDPTGGPADEPGSVETTAPDAAPDGAAVARLGRPLRVHPMERPVIRLGRADDNDVVVNDLQASRHHAELRRHPDGGIELTDLDSYNGTYVDGERVRGTVRVTDQLIEIGGRVLRITEVGLEEHASFDHFPVAARDLVVAADDGTVLLDGVSFALEESSMMAVLGPSGAGKSTLLGALTGLRPASSGQVLCAGLDLYSSLDALSRRIGYVPQDDLVQPELTVEQSIDYAARLRFPPDVSPAERDGRVIEVIDEMGLSHRRDVRVADLSGGQRKRVSIALELLTRPSLIFLDEPTSGLDPGYERSVMLVLRRLADSGRTVVLVTHSVESLHLCDRLLCLAPGGRTAWFGPPEETTAYFGRDTYQQIFQMLDIQGARDHAAAGADTEVRTPAEWAERFRADPACERYVEAPLAAYEQAMDVADEDGVPPPGRSARTWCRQLATLTARYGRIVTSDRRTVTILAITAPVLGLVLLLRLPPDQLGEVAGGDVPIFSQAPLVLFILAMGITQVATSTAVREIVKERAILARERTVGLSVSAYVLSKIIVLGGLAVVQAAVIVGIGTAKQGGPAEGVVMGSGRLELVVVAALTALGAMALGLLVSAVVTSPDRVALVLPAILGFHLIVTSGEVMPNTPRIPVIEEARYLSTARWGYAAMAATVDVEDRALTNRVLGEVADLSVEDMADLSEDDRDVLATAVPRDLAHERTVWWRDVGALVGLTVLFVGLTIAAVRRTEIR